MKSSNRLPMMLNPRHISAALLFHLLFVCLIAKAQEKPDWATNLPNYPNKVGFYQGLGRVIGSEDVNADLQKAANQARADLAAQIRVKIVSALSIEIKETSEGGKAHSSAQFESTTSQLAEATLEGVEVQRWYDKKEKIHYAYVAISKEEFEGRLNESLRNARTSASQYRLAGREALERGDVWFALTRYSDAISIVKFSEAHLGRVVLGESNEFEEGKPVLPVLMIELCQILERVRFEIVTGNDQDGQRGKPLKDLLVGRVLFTTPSGPIPLRNALLTSAFVGHSSGSLVEECRANDNGEFSITVNEVVSGQAANKIRATLALKEVDRCSQGMPDDAKCWLSANVDFTFRLKARTNVKVALMILERNLGKKSAKSGVQEEIQRNLLDKRYTIIEESNIYPSKSSARISDLIDLGRYDEIAHDASTKCDYLIVGTFDTFERSAPVQGMFFCTGKAVVRVLDVSSGQIVANAALDNEKEGGGSYEVAGMKLLQKMGRQLGVDIRAKLDKILE